MGSTSPVTMPAGDQIPGRLAAFATRAVRELLFCLLAFPLGLCFLAFPVALAEVPLGATLLTHGSQSPQAQPAGVVAVITGALMILLLVFLTPRIALGLGGVYQRLAAWLLGEGYAAVFAIFGLANLTYPFWWHLFRNHPPNVRLSPVVAVTPFGSLRIATFPGTFAAFAAGAAMVLAAPWLARGVSSADRWLMRGLLGPGRLAQRVADLEHTRALAVDDSAAMLRRLERNLHDGAQIRLATLAMNLGMAKEKLGDDGEVLDAAAVRELVDAAHRGAKDALSELRGLARGIHPPTLDNGLADALATLAAGSVIPVELDVDVPVRPRPAVETIAYFCAAELLANAAKHSSANKIKIRATGREDVLLLCVSDDGTGGADPARGSGLSGLAQRVAVVDGRLDITSPPGGPTYVTVELPLRA